MRHLGGAFPTDIVSPPHVLVMLDHAAGLPEVVDHFGASGWRLTVTRNPVESLKFVYESAVDVVVVGMHAANSSRIEFCRQLRNSSDIPIVVVAGEGGEADCVSALESGADDFLHISIGLPELNARMRAVLRRARLPRTHPAADWLSVGRISLELRGRDVRQDGTPITLKAKEFDLLVYLIDHEDQALTRRQLLEGVWGRDCSSSVRTVDVHISWLREKLEPQRRVPCHLITVLGTGYKLRGLRRGPLFEAS